MLTRIKLTNFKSWRELDIDLAPLTLLFGTNSSGKSSVLQSLLLLKQTVNNFDRKQPINFGGSERDYVDFGSYRDLVFRHDETASVGVGLDWTTKDDLWHGLRVTPSYKVFWRKVDDQVVIEKIHYDITPPLELPYIHVERQSDGTFDYKHDPKWRLLYPGRLSKPLPFEKESNPPNEAIKEPESCYALPLGIRIDHIESPGLRLGLDFGLYNDTFENLIEEIAYLGPLRQHPKRAYLWTGAAPNIIEPDGENTISAILASQRKGGSLLAETSEWLAKMGLVNTFRVQTLDSNKRFYETKVRIGGVESSLLDVGFGVSQILPVITLLFFAPEGSIILLEQPELHLHPRAQAHLADLLLHVAETRKLQLIVESHSEHLLRRLQRRVAESEYPFAIPGNIKMYFCQSGENGSEIQPVDIDKYGQIKNWPEDFFGDILGDLDAMTDAAMEERRRELEGG